MKNTIKIAFLSSIITAAMVYVVLEWKPLRSQSYEPPTVSWASSGVRLPEPPPRANITDDERNNIEVYQKYSPGVVNITTKVMGYDRSLRPVPVDSGSGSGAIIDTQGDIVTNYHVIEGAERLEVTLADKTKVSAIVVGVDPNNDLAVLRIQPQGKLTPLPLGMSTGLQVGQKVLAIGNPYGLDRTLTTGIISSLGRSIEARNGRRIDGVIQTDASINPGNSGGPLLNSSGEIIGINTAIYSESGGSVGIGFAIPVDTVRRIATDLITLGYVRHPYLGMAQPLPMADYPGLARALRINTGDTGLMVVSVQPGSPAARSGLQGATGEVIIGTYRFPTGGDIILQIDGQPVNTPQELGSIIDQHKAGDKITLTVARNNRQMDIPITLEEAPPPRR
jgi:S1-C subfamily serine protease